MSKYIDSEELIEEIKTLRVFVTWLSAGRNVLNEYMGRYRDLVLRVISEQPSVDVVEVVRCKDCEHAHQYKEDGSIYCDLTSYHVEHDSFCSYGERKE